jgi:hypothetical protein
MQYPVKWLGKAGQMQGFHVVPTVYPANRATNGASPAVLILTLSPKMVGKEGIEPPIFRSQTERLATRLFPDKEWCKARESNPHRSP